MTDRENLVCSQESVPGPEPCAFPAEGCANAKRQDLQRALEGGDSLEFAQSHTDVAAALNKVGQVDVSESVPRGDAPPPRPRSDRTG